VRASKLIYRTKLRRRRSTLRPVNIPTTALLFHTRPPDEREQPNHVHRSATSSPMGSRAPRHACSPPVGGSVTMELSDSTCRGLDTHRSYVTALRIQNSNFYQREAHRSYSNMPQAPSTSAAPPYVPVDGRAAIARLIASLPRPNRVAPSNAAAIVESQLPMSEQFQESCQQALDRRISETTDNPGR